MQATLPTIHTAPYRPGTGTEIRIRGLVSRGSAMRLPNAAHESRPWRIREIAPDFTLEDVWALPVYGDAGDFPALLAVMAAHDLTREASPVTRLLFEVRWLLGRWFGWDDGAERPIPGQAETT